MSQQFDKEYYCPREDLWHDTSCMYGVPSPVIWRTKELKIAQAIAVTTSDVEKRIVLEAEEKELGLIPMLWTLITKNRQMKKYGRIKLHIHLKLPIEWF